jgi:hypothetical protein
MPYKNESDKIANSERYRRENREKIIEKSKDRYHNLSESQREERRKKRKEWELKNKDEINKKMRERKRQHREYLVEMLGGKCCGCGTIENLQFDHIDRKQKDFCIGKSLSLKLDKLIVEAKKCQLLCDNCHKIKTTINHDMHSLSEGYAVLNVVENGDEILVTLKKMN